MGNGKGGGGASTPQNTSSTVYQQSLPAYAEPYFNNLMNTAQGLSQQPYTPYTGLQLAPLQNQQLEGLGNLEGSGQFAIPAYQTALGMVPNAVNSFQPGTVSSSYSPTNISSSYTPSTINASFTPITATSSYTNPQMFNNSQITSGYTAQTYDPTMWSTQQANQYMSPYIQAALDPQLAEMNRQFAQQQNALTSQAVGGGAFGGYRDALQQSEAQRNQNFVLNSAEAQGMQTAYQQAAQQFYADQANKFQAANFNNQNLEAQNQFNMAAQNANNQWGLAAAAQNNQAMQQQAALGLQAAGINNQYGLGAAQLAYQVGMGNNQNAATAAALGLQAGNYNNLNAQAAAQLGMTAQNANNQWAYNQAGLGLQGANLLGQLGTGSLNAMGQWGQNQLMAGSVVQNQYQNALNQQYQNFLNQQYYPYQQANWMSGIIHGVPVTANQNVTGYQSPPSPLSQIAGLGLGAAGIAGLMGNG